MNYKILPGTDLKVSELCIGTMTFGDQMQLDEAVDSCALALESGINFFDTANIYTRMNRGISEKILGEALKGKRDQAVIATKVGGGPPPRNGLSETVIRAELDESLERLQTDYVDLYYAHAPDRKTSPESFVTTMNALIDEGKIKSYGISNISAWETLEYILTAKALGLKAPVAHECVYNLVTRGAETELIPCLKKYGLGFVAYNPLAGGLLTGKHKSETPEPGTRFALERGYAIRYFNEENRAAVAALTQIADSCGLSLLALAYKWLQSQEIVTSILVGFSKIQQLKDNITIAETPLAAPLPEDELKAIYKQLSQNRYSYCQ